MAYGLTDAGFVAKRLQDIVASMNAALQAALGAGINLDSRAPLGQVRDTLAAEAASVWEAAEASYNALYPDTASGQSLDKVASITGISRLAAQSSSVTVDFYGTAGTVVPAGTLVHVDGNPTAQFETLGAGTVAATLLPFACTVTFSAIPASGSWTFTALSGVTTAALPYNVDAAAVKVALEAAQAGSTWTVTGDMTAGFTLSSDVSATYDPSVALSLAPASITALVTVTEKGGRKCSVACASVNTGAVAGEAQSITVIDTPVTGIDTCINYVAAILGRDLETDAELRTRRILELQRSATATAEGITSSLLNNVSGVSSVAVFENDTDATDGEGRPPHSFEVVVQGGTDEDIANQIWLSKPAGIQTYGTSSYVITDSSGYTHTIYFTRASALPIYLDITLTRNYNSVEGPVYPTTGDEQVLAALLAYGNTFSGGEWVIYSQLLAVIAQVPGIFGITLYLDTSPNPVSTANIQTPGGQVASFDAARITIA